MNTRAVQAAGGGRLDPARFGLWLFLVSEAMLFAGLVAAFLVLREGSSAFGGGEGRASARLVVVATAMLALSSFCLSRASVAQRQQREVRIVASWIRRALLFGALFVGMQVIEWRELLRSGLAPRTSLYWSSYFVLTGVHGLHVLGGLVTLALSWAWTRAGAHATRLALVELYWHFVGLVWLVLFVLLYWT